MPMVMMSAKTEWTEVNENETVRENSQEESEKDEQQQ